MYMKKYTRGDFVLEEWMAAFVRFLGLGACWYKLYFTFTVLQGLPQHFPS